MHLASEKNTLKSSRNSSFRNKHESSLIHHRRADSSKHRRPTIRIIQLIKLIQQLFKFKRNNSPPIHCQCNDRSMMIVHHRLPVNQSKNRSCSFHLRRLRVRLERKKTNHRLRHPFTSRRENRPVAPVFSPVLGVKSRNQQRNSKVNQRLLRGKLLRPSPLHQ